MATILTERKPAEGGTGNDEEFCHLWEKADGKRKTLCADDEILEYKNCGIWSGQKFCSACQLQICPKCIQVANIWDAIG